MTRVTKFTQPAGDYFLARMTAGEVLHIAKAKPRTFDPATLTSGGGVQREPSGKRITEIAEYCTTADAAFPTVIILGIPQENYQLNEDESELTFRGDAPFASIVDGQHRLLGIKVSEHSDRFELPVVLVLDPTEEQQALLFATINGKQTRVPASLIYELFGVTVSRSPQKTAHEVARALNAKSDSPWYRRLKMLGKKSVPGSNETLTQGTFARELLGHLSGNPSRDFDAARTGKPFEPDPSRVFRKYFMDDQDEAIVRVLVNLFGAQRDVWPDEWADPTRSTLTKTTGFMGTMWALARLVGHGQETKNLTQEHFSRVFGTARRLITEDRLRMDADSFPSSSQGIRKLQGYFERAVTTEAGAHAAENVL
jgi:DGQHR domain-containing protein